MTAPDPLRTFLDALPAWIRRDVHVDAQLISDVAALALDGADMAALADTASARLGGYVNPGAVVKHRVHRTARPGEEEGPPL